MNAPCRVVLVVDDSEDDLALMKAAWKEAGVCGTLVPLEDGARAVEYLSGAGAFADRGAHPVPNLVLLDLKMPVMTGFETLAWIRESPLYRTLPVAILTASTQPSDVETCYRLGANSYLVKPSSYQELCGLAKCIGCYWFGLNRFPAFGEAGKV